MIRFLLASYFLSISATALAQTLILAPVRPAPNSAGWNNSEVVIVFACERSVRCPDLVIIGTEGAGQVATGTAVAADGVEATASATFSIDLTPPVVSIQSSSERATTTAASMRIDAHAVDALSGLASATCNGRAAAFDARGTVECVVALHPGVNDIVVEATDRAGNSGSAGIRVTRTGVASVLHVVPDTLGLVIGEPKQLQVLDEFGRVVRNVVWRVNNPLLAQMSNDGRNAVTPLAAGSLTVTAIAGGLAPTRRSRSTPAVTYRAGRGDGGSVRLGS